jgi:hypothetical protein
VRTQSLVKLGVAASVLGASAAGAQASVASQCAQQLIVAVDACQKAVDLFQFMAPQLGLSITGGNAVIGSASTLGGPGHFSVGLRANVVGGQLPQTNGIQLNLLGARPSDFHPKGQILGLPTAEAAVGLFKGVGVGLTNVGGIDALVSAFYVPNIDADPVTVGTSGGKLALGYGVRVGVLQETALVPGVSISVLQRNLPTIDLRARIGSADSIRVTDLKTKTTAWRLAASKSFTIIGLTAGVGGDHYDTHGTAGAYVAPRQVGPATVSFNGSVASPSQTLTRTNVFAGASLRFALLRLAAEIGRASGGDVPTTFNAFDSGAGATSDRGPAKGYTYGSFGLRVAY